MFSFFGGIADAARPMCNILRPK